MNQANDKLTDRQFIKGVAIVGTAVAGLAVAPWFTIGVLATKWWLANK